MFEGIKYIDIIDNINYLKIPVTKVNLDKYNELVRYFNNLYNNKQINRDFIWTKSHGLSSDRDNLCHNLNCYEVKTYSWGAELIFSSPENGISRVQLQIGQPTKEKSFMTGRRAYTRFRNELKKDGIDIEKYFITNGMEVKKEIEKPLCELYTDIYLNKEFDNAYHLDINSAYPYVMMKMYPEWSKTIQRIYDKRKKNKVYKAVLNMTYGFFQSKLFGAKLANVSKRCIHDTNMSLLKMSILLTDSGCKVLSYNVDGLWFQCNDERLITEIDKICSNNIGDFKIDHRKCKIRFKGPKAYEYIENDITHIIYSGKTTLDKIKPREEWQWGDIFKTFQVTWVLSDEYGIIEEMEEDL